MSNEGHGSMVSPSGSAGASIVARVGMALMLRKIALLQCNSCDYIPKFVYRSHMPASILWRTLCALLHVPSSFLERNNHWNPCKTPCQSYGILRWRKIKVKTEGPCRKCIESKRGCYRLVMWYTGAWHHRILYTPWALLSYGLCILCVTSYVIICNDEDIR